jgi:hypothetical protein
MDIYATTKGGLLAKETGLSLDQGRQMGFVNTESSIGLFGMLQVTTPTLSNFSVYRIAPQARSTPIMRFDIQRNAEDVVFAKNAFHDGCLVIVKPPNQLLIYNIFVDGSRNGTIS